jgi:large subunit ribosomal protein L2
MKLKKIVKHTNGVRHQINLKKDLLSKYNTIVKNLLEYKRCNGGRNFYGRITVRHKGSGHKKMSHKFSNFDSQYSLIIKKMYNPKTNTFVSLNFNLKQNTFFKSVSLKNSYPGSLFESKKILGDYKLGNFTLLKNLATGTIISLIALKKKISLAKSAGSFCQILEKKGQRIKIKTPSGKIISVDNSSIGTIGTVDNSLNKLTVIGKAGRNRLKGLRPSVRGIAMNPVDHPHGGKSNKGMQPVTPWGLPTKNIKTRKL